MKYAVIDEFGWVKAVGHFDNPESNMVEIPEDLTIALHSNRTRYANGVFTQTTQPFFHTDRSLTWDGALGEWVDLRTLEQLKEAKWVDIKAARSIAEYSGFEWNGYTFDTDPGSQSKIQGALQLSLLISDGSFSIDWTLKDNSVLSLSASDIASVAEALATHVAACHAKGRLLRETIAVATTKEEVLLISW